MTKEESLIAHVLQRCDSCTAVASFKLAYSKVEQNLTLFCPKLSLFTLLFSFLVYLFLLLKTELRRFALSTSIFKNN